MLDPEIQAALYDPKRAGSSTRKRRSGKSGKRGPPETWYTAMLNGINTRSDVTNAKGIVLDIWKRLSPAKRAKITRQAARNKPFTYDLPLPQDHSTAGPPGTVRVVDPFNLAEVQVNVSKANYGRLRRSGMFQLMRRNDGTVALVKRCKSKKGNCNIFIDKVI